MIKKLCFAAEFFNLETMKNILVDERISGQLERAIMKMGLSPIKLPPDRRLGVAVASHPDTLLFHHKNRIITTAEYCDDAAYIFSDLREYSPEVKISFTSDERGEKYPDDCVMNALVIGDRIFCNTEYISEAIKEYAKECGLIVVHTNQGYPACTTLAFGNHAITADPGMAKTLRENGVDLLTISRGHIDLFPHEYGFIGGASFVYNNMVCFFGDVTRHPDGEEIVNFITDRGYSAVSLSEGRLIDLGGAVLL